MKNLIIDHQDGDILWHFDRENAGALVLCADHAGNTRTPIRIVLRIHDDGVIEINTGTLRYLGLTAKYTGEE